MSNLFYRRPRLLVLAVALLVVAGLSAYQVLPRSEDPELITRNALVVTRYPGASAERVESQVTEKIEDELSELDEILTVKSTSRAGVSVVSIELREDIVDVDPALSKARDKVADAEALLPAGAAKPRFDDIEITAHTLVAGLTWRGAGAPNRIVLGRLAQDLEDRFEALAGTRDVELFGLPEEEIRVTLDPTELAALGLSPTDVADALARADSKLPAGVVRGAERDLLIEVEGEFETLARVASVPIRSGADGTLVRLGDVARIEKADADPPRELAVIGGETGVTIAVRMRSDRRVDAWAATARAELAAFADGLPAGIGVVTIFDQSTYTEKRFALLTTNLALAALFVMIAVLVMMGWRSALLVGTALPLTALAVLAGMRLLGIPLEQMSVTGLIIALGLLIDNAIVVVDEVRHRLRTGSRAEAIAGAVKHLWVPLTGATATTVLAFLPLVLMPGGAGEFVGSMSVAVILAVTSSLVISLFLVATFAGWLERVGSSDQRGSFLTHGLRAGWLSRAYAVFLRGVLARPVLGVALCLILPLGGLVAGSTLTEQFFPPAGRDQVQLELRLPEGTPIERTLERTAAARSLLLEDPRVAEVHWFVGGSAQKFYYNLLENERDAPHYAQALVQLVDGWNVAETVVALQQRLDARLPGAQFIARQLEQGPPFEAPVELRLFGPDLDTLRALGDEVRLELSRVPTVTHTRATLDSGRPKLAFRPDEEELEAAGLDRAGLAARLQASLSGTFGGSLFEAGEELPVRVRLADGWRTDVERVASLELANDDGWTSLASLGELSLVPEAGAIPRRNGRRVNSVLAYVEAGTLPADSLAALTERLEAVGFRMPPGYELEIGGESAERDEAVGNLASSVAVLVVLMVATLVLSLSSFRMAALIGAVALLSVGLSLGALWMFGHPFGFMAIVGTMGLIGIAINDSIVVLSALQGDARARAGDVGAVARVVERETRHVLTTTITTVAGFTPLAFAQDGLWPPLAVAIAGGVIGATLLALVFVPSAFRLLAPRRSASTEPFLVVATAV